MAKNIKKVQAEKVEQVSENPIFRVITFVRPGMKDSRYGITRSEGLVILSVGGETIRLTCKQYYSILERVEDKKYCKIKEGHGLSELTDIANANKALIRADLEISLNGEEINNGWVWEFNSRYPELSRSEILEMVTEFGDIVTE